MKIKSFLANHKSLVKDIVTSVCLLGGSAGIVFGISAGTFKVQYMSLTGSQPRFNSYLSHNYLSEKNTSQWNMKAGHFTSDGLPIPEHDAPIWRVMKGNSAGFIDARAQEWWNKTHPGANQVLWSKYDQLKMGQEGPLLPNNPDAVRNRYNYAAMVIDGAAHTTLDRSFNQSLYQGLIDFNRNEIVNGCDAETGTDPVAERIAKSFKPTQDNTTDFIQTYASVIQNFDVVGLAGFNHSTPINTMMTHARIPGGISPIASNGDPKINKHLNETGIILLDANVPNNQNIASIQFRADQPAFLAALSTCQYFYNNLHLYHDHFQDLSVGIYGGVAIPTVTIYMGGFQRGLEFFNQVILEDNILSDNVITKYFNGDQTKETTGFPEYEEANYETFKNLVKFSKSKEKIEEILNDQSLSLAQKCAKFRSEYWQSIFDEFKVKVIKLGGFGTNFSGTFASGDAIGITKQLLNRGASAILAVAGPQSLDSAQEIRNQNSKCIVLGVDSAMEDGDYQRYHNGCDESTKTTINENDEYVDKTTAADGSKSAQSNAIIKFSAVKDIRTVTTKITKLCATGANWDIDAKPYESGYTYDDTVDAITISDENAIFHKDTGVIDGFKSGKEPGSEIRTLIIPGTIRIDNKDYNVTGVKDNAFANKLPGIKNIRIQHNLPAKQAMQFGSKAFGSAKNLTCIDMKHISSLDQITFAKDTFDQCGVNTKGQGSFIIDDDFDENDKLNIVSTFTTAGLGDQDWYLKAPDLEKATCGPGFQTCCNIKNGLISISWDGFYNLIRALCHVQFNGKDFKDCWQEAANKYISQCTEEQAEEMGRDYMYGVADIDNLNTFKKTKEDGSPTPFYKNYNHTMAILGVLLDDALMTFTAEDTLIPDPNNPGSFIQMDPQQQVEMSVLEWLDCNMYMMEQ